jgi:phospholipase/carboxylesterase
MSAPAFIHRYEAATNAKATPLLLLHGTGGDESDLLPLGRCVAPGAALLSPRGQVLEHGMSRFFRRLSEGIFDEDDVRRRADDLAAFVGEARTRYGIAAPMALGYSNGANIAAAMMLLRPQVLSGALLLRAMVPLAAAPVVDLAGKPVLILSGGQDPIVPVENAARLANVLRAAHATVEHHVLLEGHGFSKADITASRRWLQDIANARARPLTEVKFLRTRPGNHQQGDRTEGLSSAPRTEVRGNVIIPPTSLKTEEI